MANYPQHNLLREYQPKTQVIHEFVEWLNSEKRIELAEPGGRRLYPTTQNLTALVAEFFEIDLVELENEKRAMIEEQVRINESVKSRD